jgi:hypothetical protein
MDFGDGRGTLSLAVMMISALRDLRFSSDPNGANSITSVYRYIRNAWNLRQRQRKASLRETPTLHSRQERHVRDFDNLPLFNVFLVLLTTEDLPALTWNSRRVAHMDLRLDCALGRGNLIILIVLKVAVRDISVVFRRLLVVNYILAEVL